VLLLAKYKYHANRNLLNEMKGYSKEILIGVSLAILAYVTIFSAFAPVTSTAYAQTTPLFSMVLLAPTSNAARRQYAQIIATSFQQVGIAASVLYVNFDQLTERLFFTDAILPNGSVDWTKVGENFTQGGYDAGFIGWISFSPVVDSSFSNYRGDLADWAPNGNNYYLYNNSLANSLMLKIESDVNTTDQVILTHQLEHIVYNDSPDAIIYYEQQVVARSPSISDYGSPTGYSPFSFPDIQHISGVTTLNFAEAGNIFPGNNFAPQVTTASNSLYVTYVVAPLYSSLQEWNPLTGSYYLALANYVHVTPDGLHWTINFKPNNWADGVPVTADDFVFSYEAPFIPAAQSVNLGTIEAQLGTVGHFTYLNGTTITIDNSASAGRAQPFNVTAINPTTFRVDLSKPYAFFNLTYATASPLPLHYLGQFSPTQWSNLPYTTCSGPDTYPNGTKVMVNGQPQVGPFGNGPYILTSCDTTNNVYKEVQNPNYWNASGLKSIGEFTVTNYNVQWINGAQAAIAAYSTGTVNQLDAEYGLAPFQSQLQSIGARIIHAPGALEQEMGFNLKNPIWGTGTATPLGKSNPAMAAQAARDVRIAFNYLIPREQIIANLLLGAGAPGVTLISPASGLFYDSSMSAYPYDPYTARQYLASAGYNTGVSPFTSTSTAVTLSSFNIWGFPVTLSGSFSNPVTGQPYNGTLVFLQTSTDNVTFTNVASTSTDNNGKFTFEWTPPTPGTYYYRYFYSGLTVSNFNPKPVNFGGTLTFSNGTPEVNQLIIMEVSTDQVHWTQVQAWVSGNATLGTGNDGDYAFSWVPGQPGVYYYRYNFTGYYVPSSLIAAGETIDGVPTSPSYYNSLIASGQLKQTVTPSLSNVSTAVFSTGDQLIAQGILPRVAPPSYSQVYNITVTPLSQALNQVLSSYATTSQLQQATSNLATQSSVSALTAQVSSLQSQLQTITYIGYGAIIIGILAILVAVVAISRKRS
jgi:ABC-type transport system substrate-binding protein